MVEVMIMSVANTRTRIVGRMVLSCTLMICKGGPWLLRSSTDLHTYPTYASLVVVTPAVMTQAQAVAASHARWLLCPDFVPVDLVGRAATVAANVAQLRAMAAAVKGGVK